MKVNSQNRLETLNCHNFLQKEDNLKHILKTQSSWNKSAYFLFSCNLTTTEIPKNKLILSVIPTTKDFRVGQKLSCLAHDSRKLF